MKYISILALACVFGFFSIEGFAENSVYEPVPAMQHPSDNKWSKDKEEL